MNRQTGDGKTATGSATTGCTGRVDAWHGNNAGDNDMPDSKRISQQPDIRADSGWSSTGTVGIGAMGSQADDAATCSANRRSAARQRRTTIRFTRKGCKSATRLAGALKPSKRKLLNLLVLVGLVAAILVGLRFWPHPPLWAGQPLSTAVYDDSGNLLRLTLAKDERYRLWLPLSAMSPELIEATLLYEDRWFYFHPGFNPLSLARGGWRTYVLGNAPQGGSTLTMQLARLHWRLNTRTLQGKLVQIVRAVQLELFYSKDEILEAYLNLAPYGRNIEGAGTAALIYFSKRPHDLTLPESLALAALPQAPNQRVNAGYGPNAQVISSPLVRARARLFAEWLETHPQDAAQSYLFKLPLNLRPPENLPFRAPHLVSQVLERYRYRTDNVPEITTTLNLPLQTLLERRMKAYLQAGETRGINNAAVLLLDWRNMEVKALIGSGGFFKPGISGQINGTRIKRSPGSTLKPFVYALALDQGLIHPKTMLKDVPTAFSAYRPENFDSRFLGPLTATNALIRSRNVPAVHLAAQLHEPNLYRFLKSAGISRMAGEEHYGLALVLGGGELSMQELVKLYAVLPNQGVLHPLKMETEEVNANSTRQNSHGLRLLSPEACYITLEMLKQTPRPGDTLRQGNDALPVYWKTGTSWGYRDAWSVGVIGPYVLAVWLGNFDNTGNRAFVGVESAAPLFFSLIDALAAEYPDLTEPPRPRPQNVRETEVCLASGNLPTVWCPRLGKTLFIPGKSPIRVDTVHRPLYFDRESGEPVCPPYNPASMEARVFEFWPSDLRKNFAMAGLPRQTPPPAPPCSQETLPDTTGPAPGIIVPLRGKIYSLRSTPAPLQSITLSAHAEAEVHTLFWFVNDAFIGTSNPGGNLEWTPDAPGIYSLRVVDDYGRSASRELQLEFITN